MAAARAARSVLLLGDPQQLPQVSTGVHPYPVDVSALGWLSDGAAALDPRCGYFLGESWRMDSALCERVSWLSYDGALASAAATAGRARWRRRIALWWRRITRRLIVCVRR